VGPHQNEINVDLQGGATRSIPTSTEVELLYDPLQAAQAVLKTL
jgi:hypothetical protein